MFVSALDAQDLTLADHDIEWSEGTITVTNGQVLKGLIKYNSKTGLLKYEGGKETKVLTARGVTMFDYFDEIRKTQRKFYSIDAEDNKGVVRPQFFEILKELKNFAVVFTQNPMELRSKPGWGLGSSDLFGNQQYNRQKIRSVQTDVIFLIDETQELYPYMTITYEEVPRDLVEGSKSKVKTKLVGEKFLKTMTGEYFEKIHDYARTNRLRFDERDDFLMIMNYYNELNPAD